MTDGASVNFGDNSGALTTIAGLVEWDIPRIHCLNHKLELAIKKTYQGEQDFAIIKEMLDTLFQLFRNSGKTWTLYQTVATFLGLPALRFTKVSGTRFQAHVLNALKNFLRNYLTSLLFAENVEENGNGKNALVTKETYPKIVGFRKKWLKHQFVATANLFLKVLNETGHLCFMLESDAMLVYEVRDTVDEVLENLKDIRDDDDEAELMPQNIKFLSETVESENFLTANTMKIKVEATNVSFNKLQKLNKMSETERLEAEKKITRKTKTFVLNNVKQGKERIAKLRTTLIPSIITNIEDRFASVKDDSVYPAFELFNVSLWTDAPDTDMIIELDVKKLETLAERFNDPLEKHEFDLRQAKKEWIKVLKISFLICFTEKGHFLIISHF